MPAKETKLNSQTQSSRPKWECSAGRMAGIGAWRKKNKPRAWKARTPRMTDAPGQTAVRPLAPVLVSHIAPPFPRMHKQETYSAPSVSLTPFPCFNVFCLFLPLKRVFHYKISNCTGNCQPLAQCGGAGSEESPAARAERETGTAVTTFTGANYPTARLVTTWRVASGCGLRLYTTQVLPIQSSGLVLTQGGRRLRPGCQFFRMLS